MTFSRVSPRASKTPSSSCGACLGALPGPVVCVVCSCVVGWGVVAVLVERSWVVLGRRSSGGRNKRAKRTEVDGMRKRIEEGSKMKRR